MIRRQLLLIAGSLAFWVLVAIPARLLWGDAAAAYSAVALVLCLVPTSLTLFWADWAYRQPADQQFTMVLGGTGLRLFLVLVGAFALYRLVPFFQDQETPGFLLWVLIFYLFTLALETVLSVAARPGAKISGVPAGNPSPAERSS